MTETMSRDLPTDDLAETPKVRSSRLRLAGFMVAAGVAHFLVPRFYMRLVPGWIGHERAVVYGSGVIEAVCGMLVAVSSTRRLGAWMTLVVLVLVWPGNIKMAFDSGPPKLGDAASIGAWLRLPLQIPLWRWAYRHTHD